jgi:hypothetical protein
MPVVHVYAQHRRPRVDIHIGRGLYRGLVTERRDYPGGRIALHLTLWPALPDGTRRAWYYWHPQAMRMVSSGSATSPIEEHVQPGDAIRVRPGDRPHDADRIPPIPESRQYSGDQRPQLRVRVGGQWHDALLHIRQRDADGRVSLIVRICFVEDDWPVWYWRTYWWNPDAIRLRQAGEPEAPEDEETAVRFDPDDLDDWAGSREL